MGNLEGRLKKLESKLYATDERQGAILVKIVPVAGEYQRVSSVENNNIVIRREGEETEDQFFGRAELEIRALTHPKREVIVMIADGDEEN